MDSSPTGDRLTIVAFRTAAVIPAKESVMQPQTAPSLLGSVRGAAAECSVKLDDRQLAYTRRAASAVSRLPGHRRSRAPDRPVDRLTETSSLATLCGMRATDRPTGPGVSSITMEARFGAAGRCAASSRPEEAPVSIVSQPGKPDYDGPGIGCSTGLSRARSLAAAQQAVVCSHVHVVKRIALHFSSRLPRHVEIDDLIQAGMLGLLEAARRFEEGSGASFATYAGIRIRGAILDSLRRASWTPRSLHRKIRDIEAATSRMANRMGARPAAAKVAAELGVPLGIYHRALQDGAAIRLLSLEGGGPDGEELGGNATIDAAADPAEEIAEIDRRRVIVEALEKLPEKERRVLASYYDDGLSLREIGVELRISESRACQLHGRAIKRLRVVMQRWSLTGGVIADVAAGRLLS